MKESAEINISTFDENLLGRLAGFARQVHPRVADTGKRISWFSLGNPFLEGKGNSPALIALNRGGAIIGQFMLNDQEWHYKGLKNRGVFGYDFFVAENYRKSGIGALLLLKAVRGQKVFFGVGLTPAAEKLYRAAKISKIGELKKFLWVNRPFASAAHVLGHLFRFQMNAEDPSGSWSFPEIAGAGGLVFRLTRVSPTGKYDAYYDSEIIEFSRSEEFLRWRFFDSGMNYKFYLCADYYKPLFFVVRPLLRKGLKLLSLLDYKFPLKDENAWKLVLDTAKSIARKMGFDGLVSGGSCEFINRTFVREGFLPVGTPAPIVSTSRNSGAGIYLTLADADLDLNFGDA